MPFTWAHWLCQCVLTTAAVLLAGTATLRLLAWNTGLGRFTGWNRLARASGSVLLGAAMLQLGLTAADMSGLPLAQACSGQVLGSVLNSTVFGAVWKVRLGLIAAVLVIGSAQRDGGRTRASAAQQFVGALLAAAILATLVWSGHAHASDKHAWLLSADVLHVVVAGAWPGGLLPLACLLARARRDPELIPSAVTITRRFSRLSVVAVSLLALSGLLNACGLVGTFALLWPSAYGRLLLCKVVLFAAMVGLGSVNRNLIGTPADGGNAATTLRRLRRNVAWECVLAAAVLLATEALAMNAPPAGR